MIIVNSRKKEIQLEIRLQTCKLFGSDCYSFVCHNLSSKIKIQNLKNIDNMRQVMVGSISHELRTPLNGLMILLGCAKNAPNIADGFFDKYLKPALDCSDFLLNIINDILDYTQMNFKKELRLVLEEVSLKALLSSVVELLKMKAKLRRLKLIIEVDEDIPDVFTTEPRRLKQIMLNLTGNALKFTFEGHIKIMADKIEVEGA